jgi:hypothetical protein
MILSSISNGLKSILVVLIGLGIRPKYFGFKKRKMVIHEAIMPLMFE